MSALSIDTALVDTSRSGDILVVDDTVANLKLLTNILDDAGYQSRPAGDGELALRSVQARKPALILLDIRMPGMDGFEVCRRLKADDTTRDIPVIFLSSLSETGDKARGFELGAVDYIAKPFHAQEVLARIRTHLALAAAQEGLKTRNAQLHLVNERLTHEIAEREGAEAELRRHRDRLEEMVDSRTAELRKANEKYRALFIEARDGIVLIDKESGRIVDCNPEFEKQCGRKLEQLKRMRVWELRPADKADAARDVFLEVANTGGGGSRELELQQPDGTLVPIEFVASVIQIGDRPYVQSISRDITERRRAEDRIRQLSQLYATLSHTNGTIVHAAERHTLFSEICRGAVEHGRFAMAWIGLVDWETGAVRPYCHFGRAKEFLDDIRVRVNDVPEGRGPTGRSIRENRVVCIDDYATDLQAPWREAALRCGFRGSAGLPFACQGKVIGTLTLYVDEPGFFNGDQTKLLEEMSSDISFALDGFEREDRRSRAENEREMLLGKLRKALEGTIKAIAGTSEMRDPYTAGHQRRVAQLATSIAAEMGLGEERVDGIHFGSLIHDIGKICVPAEILSSPRRLTNLEMAIIRTHPQAGYDIMKDIDFPWPVAQMILQHHERLDGSGYPKGLTGDEIILEARILAVADVVEAMSSHRPYRPGLGIDKALAEIERGQGSQFDPEVVVNCLRLFRGKGFLLQAA